MAPGALAIAGALPSELVLEIPGETEPLMGRIPARRQQTRVRALIRPARNLASRAGRMPCEGFLRKRAQLEIYAFIPG